MALLVGALLAFAVALFATITRLDRDRAFYPTVTIVIASYYALFAVMGGWVLFRCDTFSHAIAYYSALIGESQGSAVRQPLAMYFDPLLATTLVLALVGSTPIGRRIGGWRDAVAARHGTRAALVLSADCLFLAMVFVAASAFLAAGTYNPFIYFRF